MKDPLIFVMPLEKKKTQLPISSSHSIPLWLIRGAKPGPTLVITAGVHGCEFVGIQTLKTFFQTVNPSKFQGTLILLPLVNPSGFYAGEKQVVPEDRKNLNREFPGSPEGSFSNQIAYAIETLIYPYADFLLDLHGGDINESLIPLVFFPATATPKVAKIAREAASYLPVPYRIPSSSNNGLYSYGAARGIPSLLLEIGCQGSHTEHELNLCHASILRLMGYLNMGGKRLEYLEQQESIENHYEIALNQGFWYPYVTPGQSIQKGMILGQLKDLDDQILQTCTAAVDAIIWYHTTTLGVNKGEPLVAYGSCPQR